MIALIRLNDKNSILKRLQRNTIIDPCGCWLWIGCITNKGYGYLSIQNVIYKVHRLSLYIHQDGFNINNPNIQALHKEICNNKNCWNPEHLYAGSTQENSKDLSNKIQKTSVYSCGHPRNAENSYINGIKLACKICMKDNANDYYKRKLLAKQGINVFIRNN